MTLPKLNKNIVLLIALVVVAAVGFFLFSGSSDTPITTVQAGGAGGVGQELVIELNRLKALQNIDTSIFKDSSYVSLQDFTQSVVVQPLGRVNPFAPVGSDL
jgi:hypothetical protein